MENYENSSQNALDRLLAISWRQDDVQIKTQISLIREYLRRAVLWAKHLDCIKYWPFFDIPYRLMPEARAPQELIEKFRERTANFPLHSIIRITCEYYLHWCEVKYNPDFIIPDLLDPYEPLIRSYELGGSFYIEDRYICVSTAGIPKHDWQRYDVSTPFIELNDKDDMGKS